MIVEFFSKEGNRLGDQNSLEGLIHEISEILIEALLGIPRIGPAPTPNVGNMPVDMSCTLYKQDSRPLIICRSSFAVHDAIDIAALSQSAEPYRQ